VKAEKVYGVADKAWQCVVGCDPHMQCAPRCWARKTVARVVACQKAEHPKRAEFFRVALSPDGKQWSGQTYLDEAHLLDPLRWRKPAVIATGFHGDWGRLAEVDQDRIFQVIALCEQHEFMLLTKQPESVRLYCEFRAHRQGYVEGNLALHPGTEYPAKPLRNVTMGCSVMSQVEADKHREPMAALATLGWKTHVWYEPAIGPVNWKGWEFLTQLIMGGESNCGGLKARSCDLAWLRDSLAWCRKIGVAPFVKQLGARPIDSELGASPVPRENVQIVKVKHRKGSDPEEWPRDLRVRQMPGACRVRIPGTSRRGEPGLTEESLECSECPWTGEEGTAVFVDAPEDSYYNCPECGEMCAHVPMDELPGADA
jgi:protein gp37